MKKHIFNEKKIEISLYFHKIRLYDRKFPVYLTKAGYLSPNTACSH